MYLNAETQGLLHEIRDHYLRYGVAITASSVFARLLHERGNIFVDRPFGADLDKVAAQIAELREQLEDAQQHGSINVQTIKRIHSEAAGLFSKPKQISNVLEAGRRGNEPFPSDYVRCAEIEGLLHQLMNECVQAMMAAR